MPLKSSSIYHKSQNCWLQCDTAQGIPQYCSLMLGLLLGERQPQRGLGSTRSHIWPPMCPRGCRISSSVSPVMLSEESSHPGLFEVSVFSCLVPCPSHAF